MHPALHSWREELPSILVRLLAYLSGLLVLSVAAAAIFQSVPAIRATTDARPEWIEIERPFPAFALSIPEANDVPSSYAIRRHAESGGRKDILTLGEPNSVSPYLQVEIYRPSSEISRFAGPKATITAAADPLGPVALRRAEEPRKARPATASASCATMTIRGCNCPAGSARAAPISSSDRRSLARSNG